MTSLATTPTPPDEEVDPMVGSVLDGRYRVDSLLGEGGLGRVYRGRHLKLDRPVAIKVLLEELREQSNVRQRFEREAKTLSALNHPNIVTITDFGVEKRDGEEIPYLVMELIDGRELETVLQDEGRLVPKRAFDIMRQLLRSLAYAHAQGIVHRDLKPGNILLRQLPDGSEHVEVLDFGLAKFFEDGAKSDPGTKLTRVGMIVGTPAYMAPEQVEGASCDARTDVYSATLVLYELLTGRMAFEGENASTLLRHHLVTPPPTLRQSMPGATANAELEAFIQRGLAKAPSERFADGAEMLAALEEVSQERAFRPSDLPPPQRKPPGSTAILTDVIRPSLDEVVARIPEPVKEAFGRASKSPLAKRIRELPKWAIAAGAAGALLVFVGMIWAIGSAFDSPPPPPLPIPQADTTLPVLEDKPDPRNPFTDSPIPEDLAPLYAKLQAGRNLSRREIGTLRAYGADHPTDPRSRLLHAHAYVARGSLSMALPLYLEAYALDPSVRGDPKMLEGIVRMARSRVLELEGANAIKGIYGDEAVDAVEQAIEEARRPDDIERLRALLDEL